MLHFSTLENIDIREITDTFNEAFSDYSIPLQLNYEQMQTKLRAEDYVPEYSVGAFYQKKMVGFILHCYREEKGIKRIYNGGTGVIPSQRGQHFTLGMYYYILPQLKEARINQVILEVLENNVPAKKSYEKVGFKTTRRLRSYFGQIQEHSTTNDIQVESLNNIDWDLLESFWSIQPSWQNASQSIRNIIDKLLVYAVYRKKELVGYTIYNPASKRIHQIAVSNKSRHQGIAKALINHIRQHNNPDVNIINVDEQDTSTLNFFDQQGWENKINLLEMKLDL